ncbi:AI-2E family transporter [Nocardioides daeguensis]|uniref:AI-2E family transporter n=1 Tax=Nocardioides daeguensis TaxID=908359 RepID=A0ABP6W8E3_9ACTN|nr:AI-2E family transporter [Nocardioides daeguensis]MBV6729771.1 AI-2E family transporter [Nocardioides daeguensis]MCR1773573.1 AI-2E family transporter [Nocardioides daeguensis]
MSSGLRPAPYWPSGWWIVRSTALVVLTVALLQAVASIASVLVLIFIGTFVAVGIEPLVTRFERRGWRRGWVIVGIAAALAAALTGVALLVAVPVAHQLGRLIDATPEIVADLGAVLGDSRAADRLQDPQVQAEAKDLAVSALAHLDGLFGSLFDAAGGVLGFLMSAGTVAAVAVYVSLALPRLRSRAHELLGEERSAVLDDVLAKVGAYVSGQALVCLTAGSVSFVAFLVLGVPYAAILAILVLLLDAIPQIGALLGAVVAIAASLTDGVGTAVAVAVFFAIYQLVENYLVAPRVFSSVIQLSPLTTFLAILVGGSLAGVLGAVAALPVAASLVVVGRHLTTAST